MIDIECGREKTAQTADGEAHSPNYQQCNEDGEILTKSTSRPQNTLAKVTSRLTTRSIRDPGPPPDGGLLAWTQIMCAWLAVMNSWGFVNSFGAFQAYYESVLPEASSTISWIGSVQACLLFSLGALSGRALDRGWFRPTIAIGIFIHLVGMFTLSISRTYWQLILTQGFCTGIGGGIFFIPIMGLCSTYFANRRGLALGIVTSGNSVGGSIYPLIVRQLLGTIGFGWTVRVLAFINVASFVLVLALMKPRLPPRKTGPLIDWEAFRDAPYCLHVLGLCFLMPPVYCVFYYIASYARDTLSMPYTTSLNLVIILNGVALPARILSGFIADRYIGALNMLIISLLGNTAVLWCWLAVNSVPAFYAWTVFYALFAGAFQSLFAATVPAYSNDISKTGTRLGMMFTVIGFSALAGGPISGALLKVADGNYAVPIAWASTSSVAGTALCITARCLKYGRKVFVRC